MFGYNGKYSSDRGITLISLIVAIIILAILTAVSINMGTGDKGLVNATKTATENFEDEQGREQLNQLVESIILKKEILGEDISFASIAEDLKKETEFVADAVAVEGQDILVSGTNNKLYEVYYNSSYGQKYVECIGEVGKRTPEISNVNYDETNLTINYQTDESQVELIYAGEKIENSNITKDGWYTIKVISSDGNLRYAWIRIAHIQDSIQIPEIKVVREIESENGWYGKNDTSNTGIDVSISLSDNTKEDKLFYKIKNSNVINNEEFVEVAEGTKVETIKTSGRTIIYAYTKDAKGNQSKVTTFIVKYDNEKPTVGEISVQGEQNEGWYTTDVVISLVNINDNTSGIDGYYYWEVASNDTLDVSMNEKNYVSEKGKTITIESDGIRKLAFQAKDKAGNLSDVTESSAVTIKKVNPEENGSPKIGEYVSYRSDDYVYNRALEVGTTSNVNEFETQTLGWRIWSIDQNTLTIISDNVIGIGGNSNLGKLALSGFSGYNNGVKTLNDICKTIYSNAELNAIGRSLNIEDVEKVLNNSVWDPKEYVSNAERKYHTYLDSEQYTTNQDYPIIHQYEEYSNIDGNAKGKGTGFTRSQQYEFYSAEPNDRSQSSLLNPTMTGWIKEMGAINFINPNYYNLLFKVKGEGGIETDIGDYWLASRYVLIGTIENAPEYGLQSITRSTVSTNKLVRAEGESINGIRPVVEINLNLVNIIGDGTAEKPYEIYKK